jgi:hypothetical protein
VEETLTRRLNDAERRRMGAKILADARNRAAEPGAGRSACHRGRRQGRGLLPGWAPGPSLARHVVPSVLDMPGRIGFPAAFSAAAGQWAAALVLCLAAFGLFLLCHSLPWRRAILQAARASRQPLDERDREAAADGGDGVRHVPLRPDRGRRAAGSLGVAQVPSAGG